MHKLYNQATWQVGRNRRHEESKRREGGRWCGRLSQVLNVAMANDALKPKTKQLPKSLCQAARWGEGRPGWLPVWPAWPAWLTCRLAGQIR